MPRCPGINLAGMPQHIIQRGINRESCFFAEEDCHCFRLYWQRTRMVLGNLWVVLALTGEEC
ncbi:MAG: hypothetical protein RL695_308 [Pseudomonadota bacterium]|jgi:hypothetical protein